jgi:hypothetical protein
MTEIELEVLIKDGASTTATLCAAQAVSRCFREHE